MRDPIAGMAHSGGVLCVITGIDGAAYRPMGAAMAFLPDGAEIGTVSSGCLESALAVEAEQVWAENQPRCVRFGRGSPWFDIQLPCGGGLDIHLWPGRDQPILSEATDSLKQRIAGSLHIPRAGFECAQLAALEPAGWHGDVFSVPRIPELELLIVGSGVETVAFAELARGAGCPLRVASDDERVSEALGEETLSLTEGVHAARAADAQTAIVLFFHEHTRETAILQAAFKGEAFWIGAQGSRRAQSNRLTALEEAGVDAAVMERLRSRIGLIPSTRDPRTLAVSVLADVFAAYKERWMDPYFQARERAEPA